MFVGQGAWWNGVEGYRLGCVMDQRGGLVEGSGGDGSFKRGGASSSGNNEKKMVVGNMKATVSESLMKVSAEGACGSAWRVGGGEEILGLGAT
ncbi:hypothetical protein E2562_020123 [Oryza meyeriana var. granulata]|uniref:DUF834 domain-containing protein n=1 Tax=Oryza meyeriana var. granulata TaxID=110450 RepID=A0A6G1EAS1_9ORYZ|nr:hypothetical protein E2562_020123 [Oryza meyeriana var. granulata]